MGRDRDSKQLLSLLEQRLEKISLSQEYAYRMMNELANLIRDHGHYEASLEYYKKALLCMKRRHKNKYVEHWETGKILINIATTHYNLSNLREVLKYYSHALDVKKKFGRF